MHWKLTTSALLVALLIGVSVPASGDGRGLCGPIDFVLVLDDTLSMGTSIGNVKAEAAALVNALDKRSGGDLRLALVTFKDDVTIDQALTFDTSAFSTALDKVTASGGVHLPEASDVALDKVLSGDAGAFRTGARRIVALVTDALPAGMDDQFTPGVDDTHATAVAQQAKTAGVLISSIFVPTPGAQGSGHIGDIRVIMDRYANITGGTSHEVHSDGTGTADAILEVIDACGGTPCSERLREKILCTTDGTGDFTYSFVFVNRGDLPVSHLYFLDPPDGVTFTPDHLTFDPPVLPGHQRLVTTPVRIEGAAPEETISFLMTAHDAALETCCSSRVVLDLPSCDCAQVTASTPPHCTLFGTPGVPVRLDRFTLQDLFGEPVEHVLVAPLSPAGVTLSPSHFDLGANPLLYGDETELSVQIDGGAPGDKVCYVISPHDAEVDDCCTIERCVKLPVCSVVIDDFHALGGTDLGLFGEHVLVSGFPSSSSGRTGGVDVDTHGAVSVDLAWDPISEDELEPVALLRKTFMAPVDGGDAAPVAVLDSTLGPAGVEFSGSFPALGATRQTIELYREGFLVGRIEHAPVDEPFRPIFNGGPLVIETDAHYTLLGPTPITQSGGTSCDPRDPMLGEGPCLFAGFTFKETLPWAFPYSTLLVDEIRLVPEDGTGDVGNLDHVRIEGAGLDTLSIETADLSFDCNGNGRRDREDIDLGDSLDLDRDGRPDECGAGGAGSVQLSTGADPATGDVLAPGAADPAWTVETVGAPARVVERPNGLWADALPGSAWVSVDPVRGTSVPGAPVLSFRRCFCLANAPGAVRLSASLFADDLATALLNGTPVAGPGGKFWGPDPLEIDLSGAVGDGLFQAGENCLDVQVDDQGGVVTGLDLAGEVRADGGFCH